MFKKHKRTIFIALAAACAVWGSAMLGNGGPNFTLFAFVGEIHEYGQAAVLGMLIRAALPCVLLGALLPLAFERMNKTALILAVCLPLAAALNIPKIFLGIPFDIDDVIVPALGIALGFSAFVLLRALMTVDKRAWGVEIGKKTFISALIIFTVIYCGAMSLYLIDAGGEFVKLPISRSAIALPDDIRLDAALGESSRALTYIRAGQEPSGAWDNAAGLAKKLGFHVGIVTDEGGLRAVYGKKSFFSAESGAWEYYDGDVRLGGTGSTTREQAAVIANETLERLFSGKEFAKPQVDALEGGGYQVYIPTKIDGHEILYDCEVVMLISVGGEIAAIKKNEGDFEVYKEKRIISPREAYERVLQGECSYLLFEPAQSVRVVSCELSYVLESANGILQPVWLFRAEVTQRSGEGSVDITVPALRYSALF